MKRILGLILLLALLSADVACASQQEMGDIYLYGEQHDQQVILERELALWNAHYHEEGLRHLFVELPYYTAAYLNEWMAAEDDAILEKLYEEWQGTAMYSQQVLAFYKQIKASCPNTVFHGTDVGHQYHTTGQRFLNDLEQSGLADSEAWRLTQACIEQGTRYYAGRDAVYRENMMAENFARTWEAIGCESVMGIYGNAHTGLQSLDHSGQVPCMAAQLAAQYGERVHSEDLAELLKSNIPLDEAEIELNGKSYRAQFFGAQDVSGFSEIYLSRDFWKLENAYADFQNLPRTSDVLPYNNYPTQVELGDVFVIDYTARGGDVVRMLYIACGRDWNGLPVTEGIQWE